MELILEQKTHDPIKFFEVRQFKFIRQRKHNSFDIMPVRIGVPFDGLDDSNLNEDSLFMVKYPWDHQDMDVWGITELKRVLEILEERYKNRDVDP